MVEIYNKGDDMNLKKEIFKTIGLSLIATLIIACGDGGNSSSDTNNTQENNTSNNTTTTIQQEKNSWLNSIPQKDLISFGFMDSSELNQTQLGNPIRVYILSEDGINNYQNGSNLDLNSSVNELKYPVIVNNQIRTLLTFSTQTNKVTRIGEADIANQLNSIENYLGTTENLGLVMVFKESAPLIFIWQESSSQLIPLLGTREMLEIDNNISDISIFNISRMIPILKNYINTQGVSNEEN